MDEKRLELHEILVGILGTRNVYYQPPETTTINYPAIIYSRADIKNTFANNNVYGQDHKYRVIVIDANPDSNFVEKMSLLKTAKFERHYTIHNLNHDAFMVYYQ